MEAPQAALMADTWLYESWNARERAGFALPPSALALEPSDLVRIGTGGREQLLRITEIGDGGRREITALGIDPAVYDRLPATARSISTLPPPVYGVPAVAFLDLPLLRGDEIAHEGYVAAFQSPWPGGTAFYRSPETTGYVLKALAPRSAIMGRTLAALAPHASGRWDRANALTVRLWFGELSSASDLSLFDGRNLAALARPDGSWEILQYRSVELIAPSTYRLTYLLRGQAGSEASSASTVPADATFVLLDGAITPAGLALADLHRTFNWRYGPANRDIGSASYATQAFAFHGIGLRPLSPVHVRGTRNGGGDIALSWVRRTRIGGDNWDLADVPLGEDSERYKIDVLDPANSAVTKRTLATSTPTAVYSQAQQVVDFGAVQTICHVRVYQLSALLGRGAAAAAIV